MIAFVCNYYIYQLDNLVPRALFPGFWQLQAICEGCFTRFDQIFKDFRYKIWHLQLICGKMEYWCCPGAGHLHTFWNPTVGFLYPWLVSSRLPLSLPCARGVGCDGKEESDHPLPPPNLVPRALFPVLEVGRPTSKAREKRPGDEVVPRPLY